MKNLGGYETNKIMEDLQEQFDSKQLCLFIKSLPKNERHSYIKELYLNQEIYLSYTLNDIEENYEEETYMQDFLEQFGRKGDE